MAGVRHRGYDEPDVLLARDRQACIIVCRAGADRLLAEVPDSDPIFIDEPEEFPDGAEANSLVLEHLAAFPYEPS